MPGGVLHEPGLVAEPVVAVLPHAVEVGLVLPVVTVGKLTVFVESEINFENKILNLMKSSNVRPCV